MGRGDDRSWLWFVGLGLLAAHVVSRALGV